MTKINKIEINKQKIGRAMKIICIYTSIGLTAILPFNNKNIKSSNNHNISFSQTEEDQELLPSENIKFENIEEPKETIIDIKNSDFVNDKITINNTEFKISDETLKSLNNCINKFNGDCSFIVVNLNDGMSLGYNVDKVYSTASTIKVAFALYCFKQMDKGNGSLEELKMYEEKFRRDGSGILKNKKSGEKYSLKDLFYYTLHYSDNVAYYMVYDRFYNEDYNTFLAELGCNNLYLKNGARWGKIDSRSMALIWQEIYKYKGETENGKYLFELLTNADYNYIKEGMENYSSAHKSGWTPRETHDSGIVFANDDYIVVTLNNNNGNYSAKSQLLKISKHIEKVIDEYSLYKGQTKEKQKILK